MIILKDVKTIHLTTEVEWQYKTNQNRELMTKRSILILMTTCRLKVQKVFKDKMACVYVGAQKTYELEFTDIHIGCPRKYKCKLNPNGKEPSIDQVMESLRSISK